MNKQKRQTILERDEHKCQFCKMTNEEHEEKYGRGIEVHHVVPKKADGSDKKKNLLTVCRFCHATLEKTQGNLLKRLYNNEVEDKIKELEKEKEQLEEKLKDRYTINQISNACSHFYSHTTLYVVKSPLICSDNYKVQYANTSKETALEKLDELKNAELKKWRIDVELNKLLDRNEEEIKKKIETNYHEKMNQ